MSAWTAWAVGPQGATDKWFTFTSSPGVRCPCVHQLHYNSTLIQWVMGSWVMGSGVRWSIVHGPLMGNMSFGPSVI